MLATGLLQSVSPSHKHSLAPLPRCRSRARPESHMTKYTKVGNFLISERLIDAAALDSALAAQQRTGVSRGKALADLGVANEGVVAAAIATLLRIELLSELPEAPPEVRALLPVAFCRKHLIAPLTLNGKSLRLAMA